MKDESRIEALEHELKILKNEIQSTLLEIREQILNHYYPELRAEEPLRSLSLPVRPAVGRPGVPTKAAAGPEPETTLSEITAKSQIQPFSDIFLDDLSDDEDEDAAELVNSRRPVVEDDDVEVLEDVDPEPPLTVREFNVRKVASAGPAPTSAAPKTREVNFRQMQQAAETPSPTPTPVATPRVSAVPASAPDLPKVNMAALAKWAREGANTVGIERTIEVIDTYANGGKLTGAARSSLLKVLDQVHAVEPDPPAGTREMLALMVALDQILDQHA